MTFTITTDADILARTIYGEARGEGYDGMKAVACVVVNRVKKPCWWGYSVKTVCLKPYQFSCWNGQDPNLVVIEKVTNDDPVFSTARGIATLAVAGDLVDNTNGATSYYAKGLATPPSWAVGKMPCAEIGNHLFFKDA